MKIIVLSIMFTLTQMMAVHAFGPGIPEIKPQTNNVESVELTIPEAVEIDDSTSSNTLLKIAELTASSAQKLLSADDYKAQDELFSEVVKKISGNNDEELLSSAKTLLKPWLVQNGEKADRYILIKSAKENLRQTQLLNTLVNDYKTDKNLESVTIDVVFSDDEWMKSSKNGKIFFAESESIASLAHGVATDLAPSKHNEYKPTVEFTELAKNLTEAISSLNNDDPVKQYIQIIVIPNLLREAIPTE